MTRKQKRLTLITSAGGVLAVAVGLVLFALNDEIVFFYDPTMVAEKGIEPGARFRLGGLVEEGSVMREEGNPEIRFRVTDGASTLPVSFSGILPDLFREGQGVVAEGTLAPGGVFKADTVLAKHDETYMPREIVESLKARGEWQHADGGSSQ